MQFKLSTARFLSIIGNKLQSLTPLVGVLALAIVFASPAGAPRVEAATVWTNGAYYGTAFPTGNTVSATERRNQYSVSGWSNDQYTGSSLTFQSTTTVPMYDRVRLKVQSSNTSCAEFMASSAWFLSTTTYTLSGSSGEPLSCSQSGDYYTFVLKAPQTTITQIGIVVGNINSSKTFVADGSYSNIGESQNSVASPNRTVDPGGMAVELCMTTCDASPPFSYNPGTLDTTNTRIISVAPSNTTVATTTPTGAATTTLITGFVKATDFATSTTQVQISYFNSGCTSLSVSAIEAVNGDCSFSRTYTLSSYGSFAVGTTSETFNYIGTWRYKAKIVNANNSWCLFGICLINRSVDLTTVSGSFVVGGVSQYDLFEAQIASTSAAIGQADMSDCTPSTFELGGCVAALFLPSASSTQVFMSTYSSEFLRRFPLGYVTDAISILSTTTVGTLTAIDATIPSSLVGGGAHVRLDITNGLSSLLNATTSTFINSSAPSDDTFYEITSVYWNLIVYVSLFFYLLTRIVGSNIIGKITHKIR